MAHNLNEIFFFSGSYSVHVNLKPEQCNTLVGNDKECFLNEKSTLHTQKHMGSHTQIVTRALTATRTHTKPFNCDAQGERATMALLLLIGRLIPRNASDQYPPVGQDLAQHSPSQWTGCNRDLGAGTHTGAHTQTLTHTWTKVCTKSHKETHNRAPVHVCAEARGPRWPHIPPALTPTKWPHIYSHIPSMQLHCREAKEAGEAKSQ